VKKLLIIYPNWLPSNAVGVQRVRLIVNFLEEFGWEPLIVCVDPAFYEEELSLDLLKIVKPGIRTFPVKARYGRKRFRLYGDITLRAYGNLKKKALEICQTEKIDCIWVPIPPFYTALIARQVHKKTGIPYGIDYIDPWVHDFPGGKGKFNKAAFSSLLAKILEPVAVKKASFITGVSESYFLPVIERNQDLKSIATCGMPYGFDANDYKVKPSNDKLLWDGIEIVKPFVYAGAFLPNAHYFIEKLFSTVSELRKNEKLDRAIRFYFVGTGQSSLQSIADYAAKYEIDDIVFEKKERIPYLEVLNNLSNAAGVLAIGSTEEHYTASKIFQAVLSEKPVFSAFHFRSSVVEILNGANADTYLVKYNPNETEEVFTAIFSRAFISFLDLANGWAPQLQALDKYSARFAAKNLTEIINSVTE
jgi:hypothetical protein